ncbi:immune inhibitor A [Alteromonadaceae bacterium 2753L.S.0a.02]|nr:immune inhibitor A [Alteromonadaceae bacterium 2753L.S.0a.02]
MFVRIFSSLVLLFFFVSAAQAAKAPHNPHGPFDVAIANEDKLINMLKASGAIPANASRHEAEEALYAILKKRSQAAALAAQNSSETPMQYSPAMQKTFGKSSWGYGKGKFSNGRFLPKPAVEEGYEGEVKKARLLTILIDFPDYPHNTITSDETDFYFDDYTKEHYAGLLFNEATFVGPNGESLISMQGYYEAQSGGSYGVSGTVAGWYTASLPAAAYGGNDPLTLNDVDPRSLVAEALLLAQADPSINLADFDIEDRYDLDEDGDYWEPDGLIDHVQIIHSSVGEEAGGGALGDDAIWSHRWNLGGIFTLDDTPTDITYWGGVMGAYDYTIQPIDAAAGVICHEYGHDLGLPDEYDTQYSGRGEPVSYWSLMASGSWTGKISGTQPSGFSPWAKEFLQSSLGGNWLSGSAIHVDDLIGSSEYFLLDQAVTKGTNNDVVRIDLPDKKTVLVTPTSGDYVYFSGSGDDLFNYMVTNVDLTAATSASVQFKASFDIETDWDYAYVAVNGEPIPGNITTVDDPYGQNLGNGITGSSDGWVDAEFDLSAYVGEVISLEFYYVTDSYVSNPGLYMDDIIVVLDDSKVLIGDAEDETESDFAYGGFVRDNGFVLSSNYYLLEWRTHAGVDQGLKYVPVGDGYMSTNQGLLVWYVDDYYSENWVGVHPGEGYLGVVDADQHTLYWSDGYAASTRYQIHDAAFSILPTPFLSASIEDPEAGTLYLFDWLNWPVRFFKDSRDYSSPELPDAGRLLPELGLKFKVVSSSWDGSVGKIKVSRKSH